MSKAHLFISKVWGIKLGLFATLENISENVTSLMLELLTNNLKMLFDRLTQRIHVFASLSKSCKIRGTSCSLPYLASLSYCCIKWEKMGTSPSRSPFKSLLQTRSGGQGTDWVSFKNTQQPPGSCFIANN